MACYKEFVSAESADKIVSAAAPAENFSHSGQRLVPRSMTVLVVDEFEMINIDHGDKKKIGTLAQVLYFPCKLRVRLSAVIQTGNNIAGKKIVLHVDKKNKKRDSHAEPDNGKSVEFKLQYVSDNGRKREEQQRHICFFFSAHGRMDHLMYDYYRID